MQCIHFLYWFQFIANDQAVECIEVFDKDKQLVNNDIDFNENVEEGQIDTITLTDFMEVDLYPCCEVEGIPCFREKNFPEIVNVAHNNNKTNMIQTYTVKHLLFARTLFSR